MKIKKLGKKNIILLIIIAILLLVLGASFAFFGWSSTAEGKDRIVDVTVSSGGGECVKASDNTKLLVPTSSKEKGRIVMMTARQTMANNALITWTLTVNKLKNDNDITNGLKNTSFKYELKNKTTGVSYGSGNFANITDQNNTIIFSTAEETLDYNTNYEFILYLWIDGINFNNNLLDMASQTYDFDIKCSITGVDSKIEAPKYISTYISNLYTPNDTETNGNETYGYTTYNLDTNNKLIEDVSGNIRYYGYSPNNYIYFNCTTYPSTECELWRIIGVFDDTVKLIKNVPLGDYSWDYDYNNDLTSTTYSNNWAESSLKNFLNDAYLNNNDDIYYNYSSGIEVATEIPVKFNTNKIGIKNNTRNLIADRVYNLGSDINYSFPKDIYEFENGIKVFSGNSTLWLGKIAIPYLSDYGYAADLSVCNQYLTNYNNSDCNLTNWMKSVVSSTSTSIMLTTDSSLNYKTLAVSIDGKAELTDVYTVKSVSPVLYLNANTVMSPTGDGSQGNPYRIIIG